MSKRSIDENVLQLQLEFPLEVNRRFDGTHNGGILIGSWGESARICLSVPKKEQCLIHTE